MKRLLVILGLLLIALIVALWQAPAALVAGAFAPKDSRVLQLHRVTGTIWRGSALFSVTGVPPSLAIAWLCRPSLAPLGVRCELSESATAVVTLDAFAGALRAERVGLAFPLRVEAGGAAAAASPYVVANLSELVATRTSLALRGNVRATEVSYRLGQADLALGEVTVECTPATDALRSSCTLSNRGGNARLDGKLTLGVSKASGAIELTPSQGQTQRLSF